MKNILKEKLPLFLLIIISLVKSLVFANYNINFIFDDNQHLLNGELLRNGFTIYRDFQSFYPPFADYSAALFTRFSQNIIYFRYLHAALFAFLPALLYLLSRKLGGSRKISFLTSLYLVFIPNRPDKYFLHTALVLGVLLLFEYLKTLEHKKLIATGVIIVFAQFFRYDLTLYLYLAGVLSILISEEKYTFTKRKIRDLIRLSFLPFVGWVLVLIWAYAKGILPFMIDQIFIVPLAVTKEMHANLLFPDLEHSLLKSINLLIESGFYWFFVLTVLGSIFYVIREKQVILRKQLVIVLSLVFFALLYIFGNMDLGHLLKGGYPFVLLISYSYSKSGRLVKAFILSVVIATLVAFAGRSYIWMQFNDTRVHFSGKGNFYMNSQYLNNTSKISAQTYTKAVNFLKEADGYVFTAPYMSSLYWHADKYPPTVYTAILQDYVHAPYDTEYIINQLKIRSVSSIVLDPYGGKGSEVGGFAAYYKDIYDYIVANYEVVYESPEGWIFMEKINSL